nr:lysozyme g-like [Salvelinus alpinus]
MAEYDKDDIKRYIDIIKEVGKEYKIAPALICGITSRETRGGRAISNPSPTITQPRLGDSGNGFGLMQVDVNPNGDNHKRRGEWDSKEHLEQATGILIRFIKRIKNKFPECTKEQLKVHIMKEIVAFGLPIIDQHPDHGMTEDPIGYIV